jgi:hypothetical protein
MPEEIKKVLVIAVEGCGGAELEARIKAGELPALKQLMAEGATLVGLAAEGSAASSWASLATGAHAVTHGVPGESVSRAQPIWEAAGKASKRGMLLGYPALGRPDLSAEAPPELGIPAVRNRAYYGEAAAFLMSSPDWDLAFVGMGPEVGDARTMDEALAEILGVADAETLRVLVGVPARGGEGLAVLAGPGVLQGKSIRRPLELADLAPTICYLAELPVPADCEGGIVYQALADPDAKVFELQTVRRNYERLRRSTGRGPMC